MIRYKTKIFLVVLISFLFIMPVIVNGQNIDFNFFQQYNYKNISQSEITGNIQIREVGGSWTDSSLTADVGKAIEFKISSYISREYVLYTIIISLPKNGDEEVFDYMELSASPIPSPLKGMFDASNTDVIWIWYQVDSSWDKDLTFKAYLRESGTYDISLSIVGIYDLDSGEYDEFSDNIQIIGQGSCCFPAGTKITMADGSYKNIEDISVGDRVRSYNIKTKKFSSWMVKMLGDPRHPVYTINNGLISATVDHPIYIKKNNGKICWGALNIKRAVKGTILREKQLEKIEIGDMVFNSNGKWVKVEKIEYNEDYVQTYNILSYLGNKNYYANGILVYEEHPKFLLFDIYKNKIRDLVSKIVN